ncbi:hypothetical protein EMIHUDRAFT_352743 [Emiliania huxleyi CCMP1516]|uniref:Eukaryotic translation initiation factor 3 subunit H n=3 Tax=Emiliania huxleyi TaxID=2903 RepID=A0A0D3K5C3_EMIH1|nr:hypothetical protein EMIHUDRAFT_352743 [Emiliania huxleyi CCMP1516]EOD30958.1 hypothetical protein EMIHUDRAFT_352743 [Emiliania huxleyi CCMP1516]|mmetsp:Transcript_446/g.1511  ORF Transcript_446/g.1511 Transcript_446/m.1511 type:complete len:336 (+) Transcript_446:71-1078(+)|eukprot:XP_005783387.1 hypothetical protein EMIHUDRAFT_352743 [Emiliania huxleyi CCMP1516]
MPSTAEPSMVVELDGLVVLKVLNHCQSALPSFVTGQLLGMDIGRTVEVTNCFPFPGKSEDVGGGGADDAAGDGDGAEYQMEMMRCLRDVNVDNNTVGWYQSTYFSSFIEESCIETQFNYQQHIKTAVLLVYDPARTRATGMPLRAFRLTDHFMALYREGKFTLQAVAAANLPRSEVFEELPLKVRHSHLSSALLLDLQPECNLPAGGADFARLELHTNPFLEKQMQLLIECTDDLQQESSKLQHYERNTQRQKAAQAAYLQKKKAEKAAKLLKGEEVADEDTSSNPLFKPIPQPSRLEALLIANQMQSYCQQINAFSGQSFAKLFLLQSLNSGAQ